MSRRAAPWLTACSCTAALGCSGYSDGSSRTDHVPEIVDASTPVRAPTPEPTAPPREPEPQPEPREPEPEPREPPTMPPQPPPTTPAPNTTANLRVARSLAYDGYLTDGMGQPLYMFVDDVVGSYESACVDSCAGAWPPFDVATREPSDELEMSDVGRFHRQDGAWQTTYKGHPLYYRASEDGTREVTGDGEELRWFVARDYLAFFSAANTFSPEGGSAMQNSFLTDGYGRTLYICLDDQPRTAASEAVSSCDTACTLQRPIFGAAETGRTTLLPSAIDPIDLRELVRPDGQRQLTYRGWPLYYFSGDTAAGSTEGHNDLAWRAIDPILFGLGTEPEPEP